MKNQKICDKSFSCYNVIIQFMIILTIFSVIRNTSAQTKVSQNLTEDDKQHNVVFSIDPLGFLTFGPSINAEVALGKYIGLQTGFRILNLGLFTQHILNEAGDFYPDMEMSWTINLETKLYIKPKEKLKGFYVGPKFDYGRSTYKDEWDFGGETNWQKEVNDVMVIGLGAGYKWIRESGFSFEPSYNMAIFFSNLRRTEDYTGFSFDYKNVAWNLDLFALYVLSIKVGIAF